MEYQKFKVILSCLVTESLSGLQETLGRLEEEAEWKLYKETYSVFATSRRGTDKGVQRHLLSPTRSQAHCEHSVSFFNITFYW